MGIFLWKRVKANLEWISIQNKSLKSSASPPSFPLCRCRCLCLCVQHLNIPFASHLLSARCPSVHLSVCHTLTHTHTRTECILKCLQVMSAAFSCNFQFHFAAMRRDKVRSKIKDRIEATTIKTTDSLL